MSCFCSRRRSSKLQVPLQHSSVGIAVEAEALEKLKIREGRVPTFRDLSDEVLSTVLLCLQGTEVVRCVGAVARFLQHRLDEAASHPSTSLWLGFLKQEFPGDQWQPEAAKGLYKILTQRRRCDSIEWRKVPCDHMLGAREGSPGMFYRYGLVFVFGGWGHGPMSDLHVGVLAAPLRLRELSIQGRGPPPSYEGKITVLDEGQGSLDSEGNFTLQVLVTGGYLHGGYYGESSSYGLLEITGAVEGDLAARWVRTGEMTARSNHTATYVPPRIAGSTFPSGYVIAFGGNSNGSPCNTLDLLDLSTFSWIENLNCQGDSPPAARNSHSATLLRCDAGEGILIVGGGSGGGENGAPPRGGSDFSDPDVGAYWLVGLDGSSPFRWKRHHLTAEVPGRGHVAAKLSGTDTVVLVSGGRLPRPQSVALASSHQTQLEQRGQPAPRAFGGGCPLPNGMILVYGGWHPRGGTYSSFWAACVDEVGSKTEFFQKLEESAEPEVQNEESDDESMFSIPLMLRMARLAQLRRQGQPHFGVGYPEFTEGMEEEDDEEADEVEDGSEELGGDDDSSEATPSSREAAGWDVFED